MANKLYKKGEELDIEITDLGNEGEGIGKTDAFIWFVKDAVIGDRIRAKVMKCKKNYGYAKLVEILSPSKQRVKPRCPVARTCGGCSLQALDYRAELKFKEEKVLNNIIRIGGFSKEDIVFYEKKEDGDKVNFYPIIGMENPWRYRNKSIFPIGKKGDELIAGFYAARTHTIIECEDCLIGIEENNVIIREILDFMKEFRLPAYDEKTGKGLLRHVLIRKGFFTGEIMVCVVISSDRLPHAKELVTRLKKIEGIKSIVCNINKNNTNVILGSRTLCLYGEEYIRDCIGDVEFCISAPSFFQINPLQTEKLYAKALEFAGLSGEETVWDLYCGIGSISLFLARKAKQVYGIEVIPEAIQDARKNAKLNGIENVRFFVGKAEEILPRIYEEAKGAEEKNGFGKNEEIKKSLDRKMQENDSLTGEKFTEKMIHPDVIVVDPPRKGCDSATLETMIKMNPKRIVYVSCDPATLARDLKYLCENGYSLRKVQPVDMFPHGGHVETVCLLSKLNTKQHIEVEVKMDELDITAGESKATYDEIKAYVLQKHGLKVSSLYIAQIKQKCGTIERVNYNKPKSTDTRQPKCPLEKEIAIIDALKYFQMI